MKHHPPSSRKRQSLLLLSLASLPLTAQADQIWIESQNTSSINVTKTNELKIESSSWGNVEFLSEKNWFTIQADENNVAKAIPDEGVLLSYALNVKEGGKHEIWNRIGFEFVRSRFDWRVDEGGWKTVSPDELTTDLMPLAEWSEIAWLKLGEMELATGSHTLQIRLPKAKNGDKWVRTLYASDAILVTSKPFTPNGKWKPDENYRTERDKRAANQIFALPDTKDGVRASVPLKGLWEVARDDENAPGEVAKPIGQLPSAPIWSAINVPADKNKERPDLGLAHRIWYRTKVSVPQSQLGRSFFIEFPLNNLNTTVYVNGQQCGFFKDPFARFQIDVTKAVKAGDNEIWVGIRDAYYGFQTQTDDPMKLRRLWNYPTSWFGKGFMDFAYPVWNAPQSGLLNTPAFYSAGKAYVSDVFVKPSVAKKQLDAEITLSNPSTEAITGEIRAFAINSNGATEKSFKTMPLSIGAGETKILNWSDSWTNPKLWWPDAPNLYNLKLQLVSNGQILDESNTEFGFREWSVDGIKYKLNGVVWHMWADLIEANSKEQYVAEYKRLNERTIRFVTAGQSGDNSLWYGLESQDALRFLDQNGLVVRRNTSPLDGETIGYKFIEDDPDLIKANGGSKLKLDLMRNWRDQCLAQIKGERNHPSIQIWSIENEFAYINLINLLGNSPEMDDYEREITKTAEAAQALDPTRSIMIDGGGATKFQTLPTHGSHYVWSSDNPNYPDLAYGANVEGGSRGRWAWDMKRPRWIGEDYFATGVNPADYAMVGGEETFLGKAQSKPAVSKVQRMLTEGYRWGGYYAAWQFWLGKGTGTGDHDQYASFAPRAVFSRQWDWTFPSGQSIKRTWGIFNDTQYPDPLVFTRTLLVGGKAAWSKKTTHSVAPGTSFKFDETIPLPTVTKRTEAKLLLTLVAGTKELFRDEKQLSIVSDPFAVIPKTTKAPLKKQPVSKKRVGLEVETRSVAQMKPQSADLALYDPTNKVTAFLKAHGVSFLPVKSLEALPKVKILLVGPDALTLEQSTSPNLAAWASEGRSVVVLEQKNPLKYQGLPAEVSLASETPTGSIAFIEDVSSPAVRGLRDKDLWTWGTGEAGSVFRSAYSKPTKGAKSLVQGGKRLVNSALLEVPTGKGLMLLSQLTIGQNLGKNVVAEQLLANLIGYGRTYKQQFRETVVCTTDAQLLKSLDTMGLKYSATTDVLKTIAGNAKLAVISATPANLKLLAANKAKVEVFNKTGGYLLLQGLTPEGLSDYNTLVGFDHMIRKFGRERVSFPDKRDPLTAGLTLGDVVLLSEQRIFGWTADEYVVSDMFDYVIDYDDVAPFAQSSFSAFSNITNGFVNADGWPLIINFEIPKNTDGSFKPAEVPMTWAKPQTLRELTWIGNTNYWPQTKVELSFDGKAKQVFDTQPNGDPQVFEIKPPIPSKQVTLSISGWQQKPGSNPLIGIDNISLKALRPADFYQKVKPMLNLGGMMHYPRGSGGIVLCNLAFKESEAVPVNASKKRAILAAVLRNLKAHFSTGNAVFVGASLNYEPVDIGKQANQYRNERGWFGDAKYTFANLPVGRQIFAGVPFQIYDFPTSPVPTAIMLGGNGVPNGIITDAVRDIPVNRKADALFFLHTARLDQRRNEQEVRADKKFEMARYVVTYADGRKEVVPLYAEIDIDDFRQQSPQALPGSQLAWTRPYEGTNLTATAYLKQWNNPRPDIEIKSVDIEYGADRRGVPVLLALTTARTR